jgi:hypothetical protein
MKQQGRGRLTDRIKAKSKEIFNYEITQTELRLMVYIQYVMTNEQRVDICKVSQEERELLSEWRKKGFIEGGASTMTITKRFWDGICELIFLGYVDID